MIVITLAGKSSRFFEKGYSTVKYKLPIGNVPIIQRILNYIPRNEKLLIILNKRFNDVAYLSSLLKYLVFENYKVVEIGDSRGQLDSVFCGLSLSHGFWQSSEYLTIFNGDTVRKSSIWHFDNCDGLIEVFEASGNHWSFVNDIGIVTRVTEKERISSFCSSGLYFFKSIEILLFHYQKRSCVHEKELFVAPFYNVLIGRGLLVKSILVDVNDFIFCGTPDEYEKALIETQC